MAQVLSVLHDLIDEFGRDRINEQANIGSSLIKEGGIKVKSKPTSVGTIQTKNGGFGSFGTVTDGGTIYAADSIDFSKGKYDPIPTVGEILFPATAVRVASAGDGLDLFNESMETAGRQAFQLLDRSILSHQAGATSGITAGNSSFTATDPSAYKPGYSYDVYTSADVYVETFRILSVVIDSTGTATVTLTSAAVNTWASTVKVYLRGQGSSTQRMANLKDVCTSGTALYGLSTTAFQSGEDNSSVVSWSNEEGGAMIDRVVARSGMRPTHLVVNSVGRRRVMNALLDQKQFIGGTHDIYGFKPEFDGLPLLLDENQLSSVVDFINKDAWYLHEFYKFGPDQDGGGQGSMGSRSALRLDNARHAYVCRISGAYEVAVKQRNCFARFSALAS